MKKLFSILFVGFFLLNVSGCAKEPKSLIVYYSLWGNTEKLATVIQEVTGADVFVIETVKSYPADSAHAAAQKDIDAGVLPELKSKVTNLADYDIVYVGTPNWFGTTSLPVKSFLKQHDLSGKTVIPFATYGGGAGDCLTDIAAACPNSTVLEGFAISGDDVKKPEINVKEKVTEWLTAFEVLKK